MAEFVKVAETGDVPVGALRACAVGGAPVVLANVEGRLYAFGGACTHDEGPLAEGDLDGDRVTCPWHFSVFDVKTGEVVESPAEDAVPTYEVRTEGTSVYVGPARG